MGSAWKWKWWLFASMKGDVPTTMKSYSDNYGKWERVFGWNLWFLWEPNEDKLSF